MSRHMRQTRNSLDRAIELHATLSQSIDEVPEGSHVRILLVDDHNIVREGLIAMLATHPEIEVVAEASDGNEAVSMYESVKPDVVLLDLRMPSMDGFQALQSLQ